MSTQKEGQEEQRWEQWVAEVARDFPYPPAPALESRIPARRERQPRLAWGLAVLAVVLILILAIRPARAALLSFLQIGQVRILLATPTPNPTPAAAEPSLALPPVTATPAGLPLPDLLGETSLAEAEAQAGFQIALPDYPPDLGSPDRVYYQDLGGPVIVAIWLQPGSVDRVRLSLQALAPGSLSVTKFGPKAIQAVEVNGQPGLWAEGPYLLEVQGAGYEAVRMVAGHVLIWELQGVTYRLESDLSLEEALRTAESLNGN